ncbi:AAA domain-containing protein [Paenibacillus sp. SYP-B4298]|uniref:AAA domain-containing protein n=1 Tax=Paenibacillus sp. SYP-B4298 TaxID=2996034 RepID=UPI0022DDE100|nr:AAA domain-containing protein [Paenibacillus sp. SYP-B4298]
MSAELKSVLQYYIRYEDYSRFLNASLGSVDGDHLPESALGNLKAITNMLNKKQKRALVQKLESYPDIKKASHELRGKWELWIDRLLSRDMGVEEFIAQLPFRYPDNRDNGKEYIEQLLSQEEFTICYPLLIKDLHNAKKQRIVRPVITFTCTLTDDALQVVSFVMNRASLEILLAQAYQCPVEDVRMIASETYQQLCTKIDSITSPQLPHIIELIDQCLREGVQDWKHASLLDMKEHRGWLMARRLFVTKEMWDEVKESIFRMEIERLMARHSASPSTLLNQYVFGNKNAVDYSSEPTKTEYHLGSYTADYPINFKQWRIMQSAPHAAILAVNGPPGTGKTTLIKEIIADSMVKKARLLTQVWDEPWQLKEKGQIRAYYQSPLAGENPYSMVITSTNNKAVDNIGIELMQEVPFLNKVLALADIHGKKVEAEEDEGEGYAFANALEEDSPMTTEHEDRGHPASAMDSKKEGAFCARLGNMANMTAFIAQKLEVTIKGLQHAEVAALQNLDLRNEFVASLSLLEEIHQRINVFQELQSLQGRLQQSEDMLLDCDAELSTIISHLYTIDHELQNLIAIRTGLEQRLHNLMLLQERESDLKSTLCREEPLTSSSYYDLANAPVIVRLRRKLFEQALAVNEQYVIKYRAEIVHNLNKVGESQRWFKSFYSENGKRLDQYESGIRAIWESFFLCFPVATTTLHSFSEKLLQPLRGLIDTLFVDEAGQIMPHYLCAPLYRSRKAVIVGDPEQLEPVRPFTQNLIEESDVQKELHDRICVLKNSVQEYADRGSEFYEFMGTKKKGIILTEHRRCEASIMRFSNFHVYHNMLVLKQEDNSNKLFGANMVALDIRGVKEMSSHHNNSEIAACKKVVDLLVGRYGNNAVQDIGIITPFSSQAEQLKRSIAGVDVGTVHTFQGKEKRFILFSSVIDGVHLKSKGLSYVIGSKPNLLNVAFSRAKEQFIWVGNIEAGLESGNYVEKAIHMIQTHGAIYSLYNEDYENPKYADHRQEAYTVYEDKHELSGVDDRFIESMNELLHANVLLNPRKHHALMLKAMEWCRSSLGIVSPWVNSNVMDETFFSLLRIAMEREVDVKVRFGYTNSKLTLQEIDKIVDRDNYSFKNKEAIKVALQRLYDELDTNLVYMPPLHTKVLLVDDSLLFIGSHNWLSNPGKLLREEISYLITNKQTIAYVKKRFAL